jgi:hypothetical protein
MRKQDRIRQEQNQDPSRKQSGAEAQPRPDEQMKAPADAQPRPPRQSGKLPIPE